MTRRSKGADCAAGGSTGIGRSINSIEQIDALQRPLTMEEGGIVLMDLLWSDPTTNDGVEGVQPSPRGPGLVTFGPDRVKDFCQVRTFLWFLAADRLWTPINVSAPRGQCLTKIDASNAGTANCGLTCPTMQSSLSNVVRPVHTVSGELVLPVSPVASSLTLAHLPAQHNDLQMIVRAHECVMDGFERFAQGHLITLFSATNYCGTANNAGAILVLGRDFVMVSAILGSRDCPCCRYGAEVAQPCMRRMTGSYAVCSQSMHCRTPSVIPSYCRSAS